jgi:hypothetical protein
MIEANLAVLRDPREGLANRLAARARLLGRTSLTREEVNSWRAYDPILASALGNRSMLVMGVRYFAVGTSIDQGEP